MNTFTNEEYTNIVFMYGKAGGNVSLGQQMYQEQYPNRRLPNERVFYDTYRRLYETGSVRVPEPEVNPGKHSVEEEEQVLKEFENDPSVSVRVVTRNCGLSTNKLSVSKNNETTEVRRETRASVRNQGSRFK